MSRKSLLSRCFPSNEHHRPGFRNRTSLRWVVCASDSVDRSRRSTERFLVKELSDRSVTISEKQPRMQRGPSSKNSIVPDPNAVVAGVSIIKGPDSSILYSYNTAMSGIGNWLDFLVKIASETQRNHMGYIRTISNVFRGQTGSRLLIVSYSYNPCGASSNTSGVGMDSFRSPFLNAQLVELFSSTAIAGRQLVVSRGHIAHILGLHMLPRVLDESPPS